MIISIYTEIAFGKIQHHYKTKAPNKLVLEGIFSTDKEYQWKTQR